MFGLVTDSLEALRELSMMSEIRTGKLKERVTILESKIEMVGETFGEIKTCSKCKCLAGFEKMSVDDNGDFFCAGCKPKIKKSKTK